MRNLIKTFCLFAGVIGVFAVSADAWSYTPLTTDSRIKTFVYNENEVYTVYSEYGYQSSIEFSKDETINTLSLGDPVVFRVTPSENRIFVKALQDNSHTNMTVITDLRTYYFDLSSIIPDGMELSYVTRFYYPEDSNDNAPARSTMGIPQSGPAFPRIQLPSAVGAAPMAAAPVPGFPPPAVRPAPAPVTMAANTAGKNFSYRFSGPDALAPLQIYDDGQSTYFRLPQNVAKPRLFMVTPDGKEIPLATTTQDGYLIANIIHSNFALRFGNEIVCVYNER